jgi:hypothetical protein
MRVIVEFFKSQYFNTKNNPCANSNREHWQPKHTVEIEQENLLCITEQICQHSHCRYPQLALRLMLHMIAGIDTEGRVHVCARQLAKTLGVHYDTVTKCLKYLREIGVLGIER